MPGEVSVDFWSNEPCRRIALAIYQSATILHAGKRLADEACSILVRRLPYRAGFCEHSTPLKTGKVYAGERRVNVKHVALIAVILGQIALAQTDQPFPNHEEPPAGWFCSPKAAALDHQCTCKRMDSDKLCEGTPAEDRQCKVWCHKDHCQCPVMCSTTN